MDEEIAIDFIFSTAYAHTRRRKIAPHTEFVADVPLRSCKSKIENWNKTRARAV
jgi:hypothetical protein